MDKNAPVLATDRRLHVTVSPFEQFGQIWKRAWFVEEEVATRVFRGF